MFVHHPIILTIDLSFFSYLKKIGTNLETKSTRIRSNINMPRTIPSSFAAILGPPTAADERIRHGQAILITIAENWL